MPKQHTGSVITPSQEDVTDAVVGASRALVGLAVRSLSATTHDVTMVQYRALVLLTYQGDQRVADLADNLGVNSSTVTRLVARLVRKGFVDRVADPNDRRATVLAITEDGRTIVGEVGSRRRAEIAGVLRRMPVETGPAMVGWLEQFTLAAGESAEQSWTLGWTR
jgi:DNA-binding MarR family transcriptional regulator